LLFEVTIRHISKYHVVLSPSICKTQTKKNMPTLSDYMPKIQMVVTIVVALVIVHQIDYHIFGGKEAREALTSTPPASE